MEIIWRIIYIDCLETCHDGLNEDLQAIIKAKYGEGSYYDFCRMERKQPKVIVKDTITKKGIDNLPDRGN